jgi:UDP-glucuronate 4-epimerase
MLSAEFLSKQVSMGNTYLSEEFEPMNDKSSTYTVMITGTAGFIGFHLASLLLARGHRVIGIDGMTEYYDVELKRRRHQMLKQNPSFIDHEIMIEDEGMLRQLVAGHEPDVIVHLAAQAGVRYSIENPKPYIDSNLIGSFNVLEAAYRNDVKHLLMASTSSVYGANIEMPFTETQQCDTPLSFYAATKKANEAMAHAYAHIHGLPVTMFRFFTVYGPWGRPDMALFKFTRAMLEGAPIDVYNHGQMQRDFTYVDDLVEAVCLLIDAVPPAADDRDEEIPDDSLSPVAPWRVVNIGNSSPVDLMVYIGAVEKVLGITAEKNMMDMQPGDVPATWAETSLLKSLTGFTPKTGVDEGVARFVAWYRDYYQV